MAAFIDVGGSHNVAVSPNTVLGHPAPACRFDAMRNVIEWTQVIVRLDRAHGIHGCFNSTVERRGFYVTIGIQRVCLALGCVRQDDAYDSEHLTVGHFTFYFPFNVADRLFVSRFFQSLDSSFLRHWTITRADC